MQIELDLHGRRIASVFELLGTKENDITFSLGWALSQSEVLREGFLAAVFPKAKDVRVERVSLQDRAGGPGITDLELRGPNVHVIIEAKRGWEVASRDQLAQYAPRLRASSVEHASLVAMSECSAEFAAIHLVPEIDGIPVVHLGWRDLERLTHSKRGTHAEKRLLGELRAYLRRIVRMQDQESNLVYLVSLSSERPEWSTLSWIEIVSSRHRYFHPAGVDGWPKEPPNYLGFRYAGRLQSIHHVESWKVITDVHKEIPELNPGIWEPHFLYVLGPPITPPKEVKTGKVYPSGRVWAMLDLLLTCDTISEARDQTDARCGERK